jgi:hypothetical protein
MSPVIQVRFIIHRLHYALVRGNRVRGRTRRRRLAERNATTDNADTRTGGTPLGAIALPHALDGKYTPGGEPASDFSNSGYACGRGAHGGCPWS